MIRLTDEKDELVYINPEQISYIKPTTQGSTGIKSSDGYVIVTESPEEVADKVLQYRFNMNRHKSLCDQWPKVEGDELLTIDYQIKHWEDVILKLAGLEEPNHE